MKNKVFKVNAILGEKGYKHFGIHPCTCYFYGCKEDDIVELELKISKDQSLPDRTFGPDEADYWGWLSEEKEEFSTLLYAQRFLLNMCFPYGIEQSEKSGQGKAYRLEIISH